MKKNPISEDKIFSLELRSRKQIKRASLTPQEDEEMLIEGSLGQLEQAHFVDGILLEIRGSRGVLRLNLAEKELLQPTRGGEK